MKSRLFVFGCSYATGEELLLDRLTELNDYRIATAKDPRKFFKKLEEQNLQEKYEKIKEEQKLIAWPQNLANKLNYECINLSESGNSLDKILYQFFEQENNIKDDDIVIISLTKATRNAVFNSGVESFQLPSRYWPVKTLLGIKNIGDIKPIINQETDKALLKWFTNDRIAWDFIKNLQILQNLNVHIVPSMTNILDSSMPILNDLYSKSKEHFLTDKGLDDFTLNRLPWGHPDKEAHDKFAEHLYEIFRQL